VRAVSRGGEHGLCCRNERLGLLVAASLLVPKPLIGILLQVPSSAAPAESATKDVQGSVLLN
jgi:hypothetical protein